jgi:ATPase subunit of ABC transporter with duplicated ATPase domains
MHAQFDHDSAQERLNEVYERMNQISASTAESRASKILHGLGFNVAMQRRPTNSFRWVRLGQPQTHM